MVAVYGELSGAWTRTLVDDARVSFADFDGFFEFEHQRLLSALYLITGDLHDAEDIMQEAFVKVLERWEAVRSMDDPTGYLYRTAMNEFRSRYRRARVALRWLPSLFGLQRDALAAIEMREDVRRALAGLTPRQRVAIVLTEMLGFRSTEAAVAMGVRDSTVRALTSQGRAALRASLEADDD
jgi:RNA polymerase sigma-70 factor (ECF subfamily)